MSYRSSKSWLTSIRKGSNALTAADDFDNVIGTIKSADSGVPSINTALQDLPYKQVGDELHVNNARWRDVEPKMRSGNVREAFSDMEITSTITASEEATLKSSLKTVCPEQNIIELEGKQNVAKNYHSDLDVTAVDGPDLEAKLSPASKEKVTSMYTKLKVAAGATLAGAGIFTTIYFTANMWDDIAKATNSRNGCFAVYVKTNTEACKLLTRTCGFGNEGSSPCDTSVTTQLNYNIYLMLKDITTNNNTLAMTALNTGDATYPALDPNLTVDNMDEVLLNPANIPTLVNYYSVIYPSGVTFDPCTLANLYNNCVACDPTQITTSVHFTDTDTLDSELTLKCITDSTVLDTMVDISTNMGVEIFSALGDSISGSFRSNFFLFMMIILFAVVGIAIFFKFRKPSNNKPTVNQGVYQDSVIPPQPPPQMAQNPNSFSNIDVFTSS